MQTLSHHRIAIEPWHAIPELLEKYDLSLDDVLTQAWLVTPQEEVLGGAAAINQCFRYIWWARPLALLYDIPGLRQFEDWLYRWIAEHRTLMPGSTPTCGIPQPTEHLPHNMEDVHGYPQTFSPDR